MIFIVPRCIGIDEGRSLSPMLMEGKANVNGNLLHKDLFHLNQVFYHASMQAPLMYICRNKHMSMIYREVKHNIAMWRTKLLKKVIKCEGGREFIWQMRIPNHLLHALFCFFIVTYLLDIKGVCCFGMWIWYFTSLQLPYYFFTNYSLFTSNFCAFFYFPLNFL